MILLNDIVPLGDLARHGDILLVRHSHKYLTEMTDKGLIDEYQSFQSKPAFKKSKFIASFLGSEKNSAIFYGIFKVTEILDKVKLPKYSNELEKYCTKENPSKDFYLNLLRIKEYDKFKGRVVINWATPRGWYSTFGNGKSKEVIKLLPNNFVKDFPGLMNVKVSFVELKKIIKNPNSHSEWYNSLTKLQAVYLILDTSTGLQYIGTTFGENGLWQRWQSYIMGDGTGGNIELINLKAQKPNFFDSFQFSILEVLSKTADKKYCIQKETVWKNKLGSRAHGLNKN